MNWTEEEREWLKALNIRPKSKEWWNKRPWWFKYWSKVFDRGRPKTHQENHKFIKQMIKTLQSGSESLERFKEWNEH